MAGLFTAWKNQNGIHTKGNLSCDEESMRYLASMLDVEIVVNAK